MTFAIIVLALLFALLFAGAILAAGLPRPR